MNEKIPISFVTTNSICQGEQVGQLWPTLFEKYSLTINFAYKEFKWTSDARGKAQVTVIIIGLGKKSIDKKQLFYLENGKLIEENPNYISPYLVGSKKILSIVTEEHHAINGLPKMQNGSQPIDGGNYIFANEEKEEFLAKEPAAKSFLKPFLGAREFLYDVDRWIWTYMI